MPLLAGYLPAACLGDAGYRLRGPAIMEKKKEKMKKKICGGKNSSSGPERVMGAGRLRA
jgi:hypothetical protein